MESRKKQEHYATIMKAVRAHRARLAPAARRLFPAPVNWGTPMLKAALLRASVVWGDTAAGLNDAVALAAFWARTCGATRYVADGLIVLLAATTTVLPEVGVIAVVLNVGVVDEVLATFIAANGTVVYGMELLED